MLVENLQSPSERKKNWGYVFVGGGDLPQQVLARMPKLLLRSSQGAPTSGWKPATLNTTAVFGDAIRACVQFDHPKFCSINL